MLQYVICLFGEKLAEKPSTSFLILNMIINNYKTKHGHSTPPQIDINLYLNIPFKTDGGQINNRGESGQHFDKLLQLADLAALDLLGEDVLGELQRQVDHQQKQLRHGEAC